ncbi:phage integrase family protein [mine drainage metagenome]|uniref:Phage integrase family protein n=1 Tax=mine drainage metagenome TaxID=410659 RepID=T0ZMU3_9ZZZZ
MLLDASGLPHWFATLFVTTQVRNNSKAPNTMVAVLGAVRNLLAWAAAQSINLEDRFARREWLLEAEIESLRAHAQSSIDSSEAHDPVVVRLPKRRETARAALGLLAGRVSGGTQYIRMTYMAAYLEWLAIRIIEREVRRVDDGTRSEITAMAVSIRMRRPRKSARSLLSARRGLSEESQQRLLELMRSDSNDNPFEHEVRQRNALIVHLLYDLGIRAGELLALKVGDFDFQRNEVVVARRHGDPRDPRANQPVLKTMDRRIALSTALSGEISRYVMSERRMYPRARRHEFLLVTHQAGPFQGMPLSMKGLNKLFATIQRADPEALGGLTAHVLRHTTNERLSAMWDANGVRPPEEEKMRSYMMGWREGSGTATTYTRRHVEKKAREASLKLQQTPRKG